MTASNRCARAEISQELCSQLGLADSPCPDPRVGRVTVTKLSWQSCLHAGEEMKTQTISSLGSLGSRTLAWLMVWNDLTGVLPQVKKLTPTFQYSTWGPREGWAGLCSSLPCFTAYTPSCQYVVLRTCVVLRSVCYHWDVL